MNTDQPRHRTVALPMYAASSPALAAFWQGLREHLRAAGLHGVPAELSRGEDLQAAWLAPDLLLGQACGYPLVTSLRDRVHLVATPCYRAEGCDGPWSTSLVVVRAGDPATTLADLRGRRVALNSRDSQSGTNALRALLAPLAKGGHFLGGTVESGAHGRSVDLVLAGDADAAAVDCVTLALLRRERPDAVVGLKVLARSRPVPSLPLVTAGSTSDADVERLRAALRAACQDPALARSREALLLDGIEVLPLSAYAVCLDMEQEAEALGYPELA